MKSGVLSKAGPSAPLKAISIASGFQPDFVEHVLEPRALPARAAHGAIAPFDAGDMRVGQAAAVAGALIDRDDLIGRQLFQIVEREFGLAVGAVAADRRSCRSWRRRPGCRTDDSGRRTRRSA